jgi:hypothetical protein
MHTCGWAPSLVSLLSSWKKQQLSYYFTLFLSRLSTSLLRSSTPWAIVLRNKYKVLRRFSFPGQISCTEVGPGVETISYEFPQQQPKSLLEYSVDQHLRLLRITIMQQWPKSIDATHYCSTMTRMILVEQCPTWFGVKNIFGISVSSTELLRLIPQFRP